MIGLLGLLELRKECLRKGRKCFVLLVSFDCCILVFLDSDWDVLAVRHLFGVDVELLYVLAQILISNQFWSERKVSISSFFSIKHVFCEVLLLQPP